MKKKKTFQLALKRAFDLFVGIVLLLFMIAIPLLIVIPLLIKLTSKGPAIFTQDRTGKDGKVKKIVNRDCVGRDADVILAKIGIRVGKDVRCIICETDFNHEFVQEELMMPILPIVRVSNIDQAIELAVKAEHGNRHTAHMHSKNIDNLSRFAKAVETTIFVKNAPSFAGIGFGGEGHTTFTIAGPTGEGITSARSFTRQRRCVMADSFRII